jgi:hypothetical protein
MISTASVPLRYPLDCAPRTAAKSRSIDTISRDIVSTNPPDVWRSRSRRSEHAETSNEPTNVVLPPRRVVPASAPRAASLAIPTLREHACDTVTSRATLQDAVRRISWRDGRDMDEPLVVDGCSVVSSSHRFVASPPAVARAPAVTRTSPIFVQIPLATRCATTLPPRLRASYRHQIAFERHDISRDRIHTHA